MTDWYAVCTTTSAERRVGAALAERLYPVFLPMETHWSVEPGRAKERRCDPLLPGYLFVLCEPEDFAEISGIEDVRGFVRYVRNDGVLWPYILPSAAILGLQMDERSGVFDDTVQVRYKPRKGERVKITAGPYFNYVAKVLETPRGKRVQLLIEGFDPPRHRKEALAHLAAA
jgi:transcription antitermination factor NusG